MNTFEKLAEVEAEEKLRQRGWIKTICQACQGYGKLYWASDELIMRPEIWMDCFLCKGTGVHWMHNPYRLPLIVKHKVSGDKTMEGFDKWMKSHIK